MREFSSSALPAGERIVHVSVGSESLAGDLAVPEAAQGVVLFAHGTGSSRHSPRNRYVAGELHKAGLATLLLDLLTLEEEEEERYTRHLRFDIPMLAERLTAAADWLARQPETRDLPIGTFGASTGAAAALITAAERPDTVRAVVSRGGRPDLAGEWLSRVGCPTLLIVGAADEPVIALNRQVIARLSAPVRLEIVPRATHLFEEPGTLERVAELAAAWFAQHLAHRSGVGKAAVV